MAWLLVVQFLWHLQQTDKLSLIIFPIYFAVISGLLATILYAMVDKDDDKKIGIKSTALIFGNYNQLITCILQAIFIILMIITGLIEQFKNFYFYSISIVIVLFVYQQSLIKKGGKNNFFKAFKNNNYVGLVLFIGIFLEFSIN